MQLILVAVCAKNAQVVRYGLPKIGNDVETTLPIITVGTTLWCRVIICSIEKKNTDGRLNMSILKQKPHQTISRS